MIVLDTNVVSELMKPERDPNVRTWLRAHSVGQFATTTICLAEIGFLDPIADQHEHTGP